VTPPASPGRDALALNLRATWARTYVRLVGSIREPAWIFSEAVLPTLGMCAYVLVYRALGAERELESVVVLGAILSTYWINVLWSMAAQFYWEKQQGQLQIYFAAPCSRMAILAGMAVGGIAMTTTRSVLMAAVGFGLFRIQLQPFDPLLLTTAFLLALAAIYALGMTLASLFLLYGREAWHLANAVQEPVYFLSGLYFPVRTLGAVGAVAAAIIPLGLGIDAVRQILLGPAARGLFPVGAEIAALGAFTLGYLGLARWALGYLETLSKREGRLTLRWD
jgi:ABC-2 type transport system permease protein